MIPRTIQGKKVKIGDILTTVGETDSRFKHKIINIRDDGLIQFEGNPNYWYSAEKMRHIYDDEDSCYS